MLLIALYSYKGTHALTLAFKAGDKFIEIGASRDPNWIHVISEYGTVGYAPKNYITSFNDDNAQYKDFIDGCIEGIHLRASEQNGVYAQREQDALQRLVQLRTSAMTTASSTIAPVPRVATKRPAPPPPSRDASAREPGGDHQISSYTEKSSPSCVAATSDITVRAPSCTGCAVLAVPAVPSEAVAIQCTPVMTAPPPLDVNAAVTALPTGLLRSMVTAVRQTANVSYTDSRQVVEVILQSVASAVPQLEPLTQAILSETEVACWRSSPDATITLQLLEELQRCKDDEQQRSWALHDDLPTITRHLQHLRDVLSNGESSAVQSVLRLEDFRPLHTLALYYQMETRLPLRGLLLQIFECACHLAAENITFMAASVLPVELAREMLLPETSVDHLTQVAAVLGMILCRADPLPYTHFSILNNSFVSLLLRGIESYSLDEATEQLAHHYMTLVLALNLQPWLRRGAPTLGTHESDASSAVATDQSLLSSAAAANESSMSAAADQKTSNSLIITDVSHPDLIKENIVLKLLSVADSTTAFAEKLLLLFNREEDPIQMFEFPQKEDFHSVLQMMEDIYSYDGTAQLFYTNDERVVCDILLRQLTDLSDRDKRRVQYLRTACGAALRGRWQEHRHRLDELRSCCTAALREDQYRALHQLLANVLERIEQ